MANGNMTIQAMRSLDPAGSMARGNQLAANEMTMRGMAQEQEQAQEFDDIRQQAFDDQGGYDIDRHKDLLMSQGYFEEALDLQELKDNEKKSKQEITKSAFEIVNKTAKITSTLGEAGWPTLRQTLINTGMATPDSLPEEYNKDAQQISSGLVGNTDKMLKVLKMRSGNEQTDMLVSGGQVVKKGDPYDPTSKSGGDFDFSASDSNSNRNAAAGLYGGHTDPQSGKIVGVNPDQQKNVLAISAAADRIQIDEGKKGNIVGSNEAARMAANMLGMDEEIRDLVREQAEGHTGKLQELGLPEKAARQITAEALMKKDISDIEASQRAYQIAMRSFQGDSEEAEKVRRRVIEMRAGNRPTGGQEKPEGQYEEGKVYEDAEGNKARYVNGQWEPVQ